MPIRLGVAISPSRGSRRSSGGLWRRAANAAPPCHVNRRSHSRGSPQGSVVARTDALTHPALRWLPLPLPRAVACQGSRRSGGDESRHQQKREQPKAYESAGRPQSTPMRVRTWSQQARHEQGRRQQVASNPLYEQKQRPGRHRPRHWAPLAWEAPPRTSQRAPTGWKPPPKRAHDNPPFGAVSIANMMASASGPPETKVRRPSSSSGAPSR